MEDSQVGFFEDLRKKTEEWFGCIQTRDDCDDEITVNFERSGVQQSGKYGIPQALDIIKNTLLDEGTNKVVEICTEQYNTLYSELLTPVIKQIVASYCRQLKTFREYAIKKTTIKKTTIKTIIKKTENDAIRTACLPTSKTNKFKFVVKVDEYPTTGVTCTAGDTVDVIEKSFAEKLKEKLDGFTEIDNEIIILENGPNYSAKKKSNCEKCNNYVVKYQISMAGNAYKTSNYNSSYCENCPVFKIDNLDFTFEEYKKMCESFLTKCEQRCKGCSRGWVKIRCSLCPIENHDKEECLFCKKSISVIGFSKHLLKCKSRIGESMAYIEAYPFIDSKHVIKINKNENKEICMLCGTYANFKLTKGHKCLPFMETLFQRKLLVLQHSQLDQTSKFETFNILRNKFVQNESGHNLSLEQFFEENNKFKKYVARNTNCRWCGKNVKIHNYIDHRNHCGYFIVNEFVMNLCNVCGKEYSEKFRHKCKGLNIKKTIISDAVIDTSSDPSNIAAVGGDDVLVLKKKRLRSNKRTGKFTDFKFRYKKKGRIAVPLTMSCKSCFKLIKIASAHNHLLSCIKYRKPYLIKKLQFENPDFEMRTTEFQNREEILKITLKLFDWVPPKIRARMHIDHFEDSLLKLTSIYCVADLKRISAKKVIAFVIDKKLDITKDINLDLNLDINLDCANKNKDDIKHRDDHIDLSNLDDTTVIDDLV